MQVIDGAFRVTDFPDLGKLQKHVIADAHMCAQGQRKQIDTFGGNVFGEIAFCHVKVHGTSLLDGLPG